MSRVLLIVAILGLLAAVVLFLSGGCMTRPIEETEQAIHVLWTKRGQTVGDLVYLYCEHGSRRERSIMATAIERAAYPAVVTLTCVRFFPAPGERLQPAPKPGPDTPLR